MVGGTIPIVPYRETFDLTTIDFSYPPRCAGSATSFTEQGSGLNICECTHSRCCSCDLMVAALAADVPAGSLEP
jgi:hypothetical protein